MKTRIAVFSILAALALNTAYGRYVTLVINTDTSSGEPVTPTNSISIKLNEAARIISTLPTPYYGGGYGGYGYSYTNYSPLCLYTINGVSVLSDVYGMMLVGPATISIVPNPSWGSQGSKAIATIEITSNLSSQYGRYVTLVINSDASSGEPVILTNSTSINRYQVASISTLPGPYYGGYSYTNGPLCLYTINGISVPSEGYGPMVAGPAKISIVPNLSWGLQGGKALATIVINPNPTRQNRQLIGAAPAPGMPPGMPGVGLTLLWHQAEAAPASGMPPGIIPIAPAP